MDVEQLSRLCFANRPILWALAIIAVLIAAVIFLPRFWEKSDTALPQEGSSI
jgi:hypothetical protein